jgi:hypothetical protein
MLRRDGEIMKSPYIAVLGSLLAFAAGTGHAQSSNQAEKLPISMQAQIGATTEIQCQGPTAIPFTPASGSTKALKCGDSLTIAGVRGGSYFVRIENGSTGYVPVDVLPTDPCVQTHFRSTQFRKLWLARVDSLSKEDFWKFKNELYLKVTADDVSVAYKCLSESMDTEQLLGGMAGFASSLNPTFNLSAPATISPSTKSNLMEFAEALDLQVDALNLLTSASAAQTFAYAMKHDELMDRYNALVDKQTIFRNFVEQRLHDLDSASTPDSQPNASPWRQLLDGALQGMVNFTPPKHLVCDAKVDASQFGNPFQPGFIYLNASASSPIDCKEQ